MNAETGWKDSKKTSVSLGVSASVAARSESGGFDVSIMLLLSESSE